MVEAPSPFALRRHFLYSAACRVRFAPGRFHAAGDAHDAGPCTGGHTRTFANQHTVSDRSACSHSDDPACSHSDDLAIAHSEPDGRHRGCLRYS